MKSGLPNELKALGISPSKARGQNFLIDKEAVRTILDFAELLEDEPILEVGPGLGALTYELAFRAKNLTVIEIEGEFARELSEKISVRVIEKDVRKVNLSDYFTSSVKVISNVPYSISSDFSLWLFREHKLVKSASLLLQREFADRLGASEGSRDYGSLSVLRSVYCSAEIGEIIPPSAFYPQPKVESQLIKLDFTSPEIVLGTVPQPEFERFVRAAFSQKRKTLANALGSSPLFENKTKASEFLSALGLAPSVRAEEISPKVFLQLTAAYLSGS